MAKVELIDPEEIPGGYRGRLIQEAKEHLKQALQGAKALRIVLEPHERPSPCIQTYRHAAKALGIGLCIRRVGSRAYHKEDGKQRVEARELYIAITKARPVKPAASAPRPISIPAASFEPTLLPGVEVSR